MLAAFNLAGFFAAHAIWSVSDEDGFIPMFAFTGAAGNREMQRLVSDDMLESVRLGQQKIASNEAGATAAVLVYDALIPLDGTKYDAIVLEIRDYLTPGSTAVMAVPYARSPSGQFKVFRPKLQAWEPCGDCTMDDAVQSFFAGVDAHQMGAAIWNKSMDQSL